MKYLLRLSVLVFILVLPLSIQAEVKEIICEGTYNMGDGETPSVAESRALLQAKRVAIEQAGTYVVSYSKVKNLQLTEDEIKVMASGIMEVTELDKKRTVVGDGFHFWVRIKAIVNSDKMEDMAKKAKDKNSVEEYKNIQAAYDKSQKEIEELKKQLVIANGDQKKEVEIKIADDEKRFQANQWYEKGTGYYYGSAWKKDKEYDKALEAFTVAIAMDPSNGKAYALRGDCYRLEGNFTKAISDYKKAASLCSEDCLKQDKYGLVFLCMEMGGQYFHKKDYYSAIEAFSIPVNIYDNLTDQTYRDLNNLYKWRGLSYYSIGEYSRAVEDYNKAFSIARGLSNEEKGSVYTNRGVAYERLGRINNAIVDYQKACDLGNGTGCNNLQAFPKEKRERAERELAAEREKQLATVMRTFTATAIKEDGRFIAYDNGTVLDKRTNLMWAAKDNGSKISWASAKSYCENYRGGGYTDWRMPTQDELAKLYDKSKSRPDVCHNSSLYAIHVATELIDITCSATWAIESNSFPGDAYFSFEIGSPWYQPRDIEWSGVRALPVRSVR